MSPNLYTKLELHIPLTSHYLDIMSNTRQMYEDLAGMEYEVDKSPYDSPTAQQRIQLVHSKGQFNLSYYFGTHYTQGQAQI